MKKFAISFSILALSFCLSLPNSAFAFEKTKNQNSSDIKTASPMDCDCRAQGQIWRQGEQVCLNGNLRICGMNQNVTTWLSTGKSCPTAQSVRSKS